MHIKIVGFKIHLDVEFIFKNNEMTLLKGGSGAGKSTILQAIFWAMYGNMRSIYNNARITKNLSVTLSLPGITIFRKKNPDLLSVTIEDGKVYSDAIAQAIIDSQYGGRDLWKACSYIEQKARCALLSGSGGERLEMLNALSFTGENPKEYISKINEKLKEVNLEFEKNQASFLTELNIYNEDAGKVKKVLKLEEIASLKSQVSELENLSIKINNKVLEQERLLGTLNYLNSNFNSLITQLNSLKASGMKTFEEVKLEEEISIPQELYIPNSAPLNTSNNTMNNTLNDTRNSQGISFLEYSNKKKKLTTEINNLYEAAARNERIEKELKEVQSQLSFQNIQNAPLQKIEIKKEDIWKVSQFQEERKKYIVECQTIGLEYNEDIIKETLEKLSDQLKTYTNLERHVSNYTKLLNLEEQLSKVFKDTEDNVEELEKISKEKNSLIMDMRRGLELLSCPSCKAPLRYKNGTLTVGERDPVSLSEIQQVEKEYNEMIAKIKSITTLKQNVDLLNKSITVDKADLAKFDRSKITSLSALINRISKIKFIEEKNVQEMENVYNYQQLKKKENELLSLQKSDTSNIEVYKKDLEELENLYSLEQKRIKEEQKRIKEEQDEMAKYQKLESERIEKSKQYEQINNDIKLRNQNKLKMYEQQKKEKEERENQISSLESRIVEIEKEKSKIFVDYNCKTELENCKKEIQDKKKMIEDGNYALKIVEKGKVLEEKRNKLLSVQKDVEALNKLKLKAVEVECKQLEETVNNINTVVQTTLPIFFNEPISLTLNLYKKVKDNLKPGLNMEICYKGFKYDNINLLSGGEGDRISLALLLALNFVSNSPIIMLDECVSSLDGDLKESCITAIKSIPNKTVICIDHDDTIEGYYDSVILLQ